MSKVKLLARLSGRCVYTRANGHRLKCEDSLCLNVDIDIRQVIEDVKHFGVSAPEFKELRKYTT
jgi:hypothetical protein